MRNDIDRILFSRHEIARRVEEVAHEITRDFAHAGPTSEMGEITLIPILTGSIIFVADLMRHLPLRMKIRVLSVSSYPGKATSSQGPTIQGQIASLPADLKGTHILLIDDILDSGRTLGMVSELIKKSNPAVLKTCVLLRKRRPEAMAFPVDYVCFDIPDEFVVGYGLDFDDYYRNLPDVVILRPEVFEAAKPRVAP